MTEVPVQRPTPLHSVSTARRSAERLRAVDRAGLSTASDDRVLSDLCDVARELAAGGYATVSSTDGVTSWICAASGDGPAAGTVEGAGGAVEHAVVDSGVPLVLDALPGTPDGGDPAPATPGRSGSVCSVPVFGEAGHVVAALRVARTGAGEWTPRTVRLLTALARTLGAHLRMAGSMRVSQDLADRLGARLARSESQQQTLSDELGDSQRRTDLLESGLLPPVLPEIAGAEVAAVYVPGAVGEHVVGDFYDLFAVGDRYCLVIGDVCGKGVQASQIAVVARYTIRGAAARDLEVGSIVASVDGTVRTMDERAMLTVVVVVLEHDPDGGLRAEIASAGHEPALVLRADGAVERYGTGGTMLGLPIPCRVATDVVRLGSGDALLLYTDGVTEARPVAGADLFGDDRLTDLFRTCAGLDAAGTVAAVHRGVSAYARGMTKDDTAIVALRVT
ncbi:PP2C family protein-serine/threonine phosphatase [Pseudonocardia sp. TMWB2A]|uniref:PP2C family protein-serine/threonine phosphatase n=1 Tax=Pseudonocardia sp. TMWB2A TaxID=687430 RepID=UPI00307EBC32